MVSETGLFVTALVTLVVSMGLAISIAWFIPPHHVNAPGYIKYDEKDTAADIWSKCNCTIPGNGLNESNDSIPEIGTWNNVSRPQIITNLIRRNETSNWTDPWTREIIYENPKRSVPNWSYYSGIVSILIRKYVDDYQDALLDYGGNGFIYGDSSIIAGAACFRTIKDCAVNGPPAHCIQMIRIRSRSPFWSMRGKLRNITMYWVHPNKKLVLFQVQEKFVNDVEAHGKYPTKEWKAMLNSKDLQRIYYSYEGFYGQGALANQKYNLQRSSQEVLYTDNPRCIKLSKPIISLWTAGELLLRPFTTSCRELVAFETENGDALDINQQIYFDWILGKRHKIQRRYSDTNLREVQGSCSAGGSGDLCSLPDAV